MKPRSIRFIKKILLLFLLINLSSCEDLFRSTEYKIVGKWVYEEVKFTKSFHLIGDDVTSNFSEIVLHFLENYEVTMTFDDSGETLYGYWEIEQYEVYDEETDIYTIEETLVFEIFNFNDEWETYVWEDFTISFDKIKALEYMSDGTYKYKLSRY